MEENTSTTSQQDRHWFANFDWRTNAVLILLASVFGFSGGAVAPKSTAQGITQDSADVRYITKEEGNRRADARDRQVDEIKKSMVTTPIFDERTNMILKQLEMIRQEIKEERSARERMVTNR